MEGPWKGWTSRRELDKGQGYIGFLDMAELSSAEISRMRIGGILIPELGGGQRLVGFPVLGLVLHTASQKLSL